MCTVVIFRKPSSNWPLVMAANRDEMADRPWKAPARHWPDRVDVVAGLDEEAGGSWQGLNDFGVVAAVLNREGTLGPAPDKRSRGELVLDALDFADAKDAAKALSHIVPGAFRPFNMVIADNRDAYWLRNTGEGPVEAFEIPEGLSMITARDLDDPSDPRIDFFRSHLAALPDPIPDSSAWKAWEKVMGTQGDGPSRALCFQREDGFGTRSSALIALPSIKNKDLAPIWRFAPGPPDATPYENVII